MKYLFLKAFNQIITLFLHLIFIFIALHIVVYIHEWTHGIVAWLFGYKSSPFDIYYGNDWIFLSDINEAVNYPSIYADQKKYVVGLIAIAPMLIDACLFILGLFFIKKWNVLKSRLAAFLIYWITLMALADIYAYIPIRTFAKSEDIFNFCHSTGISNFAVAFTGGAFVCWGFFQFFWKLRDKIHIQMKIENVWSHQSLLLLSLFLFFVYFGGVGFLQPNTTAHFLSFFSWALFPLSILSYNLLRRFITA